MSLVDLGKLAEPATALVNRVSDAVGGIAKPWQIKRVAKADAIAVRIAAEANVEVNEIEQRGLQRMIKEQARDQENIENITSKAIPYLEDKAEPYKLEEDFLRQLFDRARLVSDGDMQEIWAKILAGEANKKGSFSKRTLELVSHLEMEDAVLFTKLCNYVWSAGGGMPIIEPTRKPLEDRTTIDFVHPELVHLDSIGLISFTATGLTVRNLSKNVRLLYFGTIVDFEFERPSNNALRAGNVSFTHAGSQLSKISGGCPSKKIFNQSLELFAKSGAVISIPIEMKSKIEEFKD